MSEESAVYFSQVDADRGERRVLTDISLELDARRIAVIGANGSGKSTFARLCNGLVPRSGGELRVLGLDPDQDGPELRRRVGFVFPNPATQILMPTVREDLAFTLRAHRLGKLEVQQRVEAAIDRWQLQDLADSPAHELSSGQQQLLALASVLIGEPALLIADEPTALLDAANARRISRILLEEMTAKLMLVTHDLELAQRCDVAIWIHEARIGAIGEPARVVAHYLRALDERSPA